MSVRLPFVFGWQDKVRRTGASLHAPCPQCGRVVKMFEAVKHFNVSAFFAVSLWDDEEAVGHMFGDVHIAHALAWLRGVRKPAG